MVGSLKKGVISFSTVAMIAFQSFRGGHIRAFSDVGRMKGQPMLEGRSLHCMKLQFSFITADGLCLNLKI